jgi:hypothetical protein
LRLAGAADAIRHTVRAAVFGDAAQAILRRDLNEARRALGDRAIAAEMEGWAMSMDAAIEHALSDETVDTDSP